MGWDELSEEDKIIMESLNAFKEARDADAVNKSVKYYMIATLRIIYHYKCTMQVAPNTSICDSIVNLVIKLKKK